MNSLLRGKIKATLKFWRDIKRTEKVMGKDHRIVKMAREKLKVLLDEIKELRKTTGDIS